MVSKTVDLEPKIAAFVCNWCTYMGADPAGTSRISYPANVRIVRLMCSGAVAPRVRAQVARGRR
jgi:coenzyme F420-reducing hydrogenase delta subunit